MKTQVLTLFIIRPSVIAGWLMILSKRCGLKTRVVQVSDRAVTNLDQLDVNCSRQRDRRFRLGPRILGLLDIARRNETTGLLAGQRDFDLFRRFNTHKHLQSILNAFVDLIRFNLRIIVV